MLLEDMFINIDVDEIPKYTKVAGVSFYDRQEVIGKIQEGDILKLKRDYKNEKDKFAIAVMSKHGQIGWLPKWLSEKLASEIDCGLKWDVNVSSVTGKEKDTKGVNIRLLFLDK